MFDPSILNYKSASLNEDVKLLKEFSQSSISHESAPITQMSELTQILKSRNQKYKYTEEVKANVQQWIKRKGADITPLLTKVRTLKMNEQKEQMRHISESDCYFYMGDLNYDNQKQYIKKNFEFGLFAGMQRSMSSSKSDSRYRLSLAQKILQQKRNGGSKLINLPMINFQNRNQKKKKGYVQSTKNFFCNSESMVEPHNWVDTYCYCSEESFWNIIKEHIRVSTYIQKNNNGQNKFVAMAIASLKMLENYYNQQLPSGHQNILESLNKEYLYIMNNEQQNYITLGSYGAIWGKAFLLYRCGRKEEFYSSIQDEELRKAFKEADQSIEKLQPKKIETIQKLNIDDVFYEQLYFALRGISKYASSILCQRLDSPDICWIMLRNVAIFGDQKKLTQLRESLCKDYQGPFMTAMQVKNLLYLMGYKQLVFEGPNQVMDQDDFLHFLIITYYNAKILQIPKQAVEKIEKKLTEQLVNYIHELLFSQSNQNDYIYYLLLIPNRLLANQASSIIASSQLVEKVDWEFFQKRLSKQIYENLVNQTLSKHASFYEQYLKVSKLQFKLMKNHQLVLKYLIEMNAKAVLDASYNKNELNNGRFLKLKVFDQKPELKKKYESVFELFEENSRIYELIRSRNENQIHSCFKNSQFLLVHDIVPQATRSALDGLIANQYYECYFIYVKNTIKALQIALIKKNQIKDLKLALKLILQSIKKLLSIEPYGSKSQKTSAKEIERMLQEQVNSD